jgi:tubulin polyglutamylase TTLL5
MGVDDVRIWQKIDDIVLKTIISAENVINNATEMFCPFRTNCFELFGFDILIDAEYEPWLIEVNLCPALSCDSPLDQKIKSNVIADLFSLCGIMHLDERPKEHQQPKKNTIAAYGYPNPHKRGVSQNRGANLTQKPAL